MPNTALISTVKAPTNELMEFVSYHLDIGIDEILLYFDDPEDKAISLFKNEAKVQVIVCNLEYWKKRGVPKPDSIEARQIINLNHGVKFLRANDFKWMIHLDSDELILNTIQQPIHQVLENTSADIVRLTMREAIANQPYPASVFQAKWFKKPVGAEEIEKAIRLGCKDAFYEGEFFRGHMDSKAFVRLNAGIEKYGIHCPDVFSSDTIVQWLEDLKLLHFDCVGIDAWKTKWDRRLDGSATAKKMRKNRSLQLKEYDLAKQLGDEQLLKLYKKMHMVSIKEKIILLLLGMLERINVNKKSF